MDLPYSSGASVDLLGEEGIGEYGVRECGGQGWGTNIYRLLSLFIPHRGGSFRHPTSFRFITSRDYMGSSAMLPRSNLKQPSE
jgi:hypothetical protein